MTTLIFRKPTSIAYMLAAFILASCPAPLTQTALSVLSDLNGPSISLTTPVQGSAFESTVTVSGTVVDRDAAGLARSGDDATDYVRSLWWDILDADDTTTAVTVNADGSFSFSFASGDRDAQFTLQVGATDTNGNESTVSIILVPDADGPFLTITSPEDYGEYGTLLTISGTATNSLADARTTEVHPTVSYSIPGTAVAGTAVVDTATGAFTATANVSAVTGSRTVEVIATDLNGNETTAVVTIVKPLIGGDISGFTVTPGNKKVTISWNPVQGAESYTLTNTGMVRTGVTSPYEWTSLENGEPYTFQLTAILPDDVGEDAVSASIEKIPLSIQSLAPRVTSVDSRSITLEWASFDNIQKYILSRATSPEGPWYTVRNPLTNTFTDTTLAHDTEYFYKVTPYYFADIQSASVSAVPGRFKYLDDVSPILTTMGGYANDVAVQGSYAYVSNIDNGLVVFDINNPDAPVKLGEVTTPGNGSGVAVSGTLAFVADDGFGLQIIDVSNPASPGIIKTVDTPGSAKGVVASGSYAYVADGENGLVIVNVASPASATIVGTCITAAAGDTANAVALYGNYAYLAASTTGLVRVDISNPASPTETGTFSITGDVWDVTVSPSGTHAYVAAGDDGLIVVQLSDMTGAGTYNTPGSAKGVAAYGSFVYVADDTNGVVIIDAGTLSDLKPFGTVDLEPNAYGIAMSGSHVFVANNTKGLASIDVASPADASFVYATPSTATHTSALATGNGYAFVCDAEWGTLTSFSLSSPDAPLKSDSVEAGRSAGSTTRDVVIAGDYAYVAAEYAGLYIVDISNPGAMKVAGITRIGTAPGYTSANGVAVSGGYAYVAAGDSGLVVVDVNDPTQPVQVASISGLATTGFALGVAISGTNAYVAHGAVSGYKGLAKYNISDPVHPVFIDDAGTAAICQRVEVSGDYAYVANDSGGLAIVYIGTNMLSIQEHTPYATGGTAYGVAISGKYAALAAGTSGLTIIDISNPSAIPILPGATIAEVATAGNSAIDDARDVVIRGSYAYVADDDNGLVAIRLWEDME